MGTRADFYVGKGEDAEWIGSIGWDGYPEGIDAAVLQALTESDYRAAVNTFFEGRDDATLPAYGWPWPWNDSGLTDHHYAFSDGSVQIDSFTEFPDMTEAKNVSWGKRSGLITIVGSIVED